MRNKPYQTGMTLIEIMIALLIGAFLLGGVVQIFINSKQTHRMQDNMSRLQENGRFAMEFLAKDMRMAGYWGCLKALAGPANIDITGTDGGGTDPNTVPDTISLRGAFTQPVPPAVSASTCGDTISTTNAYYTHASSTATYRINSNVLQKNTVDLIEGVENMQILYGVDTDADGTPNSYVPGTTGTGGNFPVAGSAAVSPQNEWGTVVSIRVSLVLRTLDDNLTTQAVPYGYIKNDGSAVSLTPADKRIRRVFTTTIALRNRQP